MLFSTHLELNPLYRPIYLLKITLCMRLKRVLRRLTFIELLDLFYYFLLKMRYDSNFVFVVFFHYRSRTYHGGQSQKSHDLSASYFLSFLFPFIFSQCLDSSSLKWDLCLSCVLSKEFGICEDNLWMHWNVISCIERGCEPVQN